MTWGTRGRAQHSIEAVLGTFLGEPVLPCLMDLICFDGLQFHKWFLMQLKTCIVHSQSLRNTCETQLSGKGREPNDDGSGWLIISPGVSSGPSH